MSQLFNRPAKRPAKRHFVTDILLNEDSGKELRVPIVGKSGMYHSGIYAGKCGRTHHHLVIDFDKGRTPGVRKLTDFSKDFSQVSWGDSPTRQPEDVVTSALNEVFKKHGRNIDYDFILNNCQTFSSRHQHGWPVSRQVQNFAVEYAKTSYQIGEFVGDCLIEGAKVWTKWLLS